MSYAYQQGWFVNQEHKNKQQKFPIRANIEIKDTVAQNDQEYLLLEKKQYKSGESNGLTLTPNTTMAEILNYKKAQTKEADISNDINKPDVHYFSRKTK